MTNASDTARGLLFTWRPDEDLMLISAVGLAAVEGLRDGHLTDFLDLVHPEDRAGAEHALRDALTGARLQLPCRMRAFGANHTSVLLAGHGVRNDGEKAAMVSGAVLERSADRAALDTFIQATNASPNTIFLLDFDTNQHFWSKAFHDHFGHEPFVGPDVVEQWFDLVHPDDKARIHASHGTARAGGADRWQDEYRMRRADGSYATVIDRASFFRRPDGSVARSVSSLEDVTLLREREQDLWLSTKVTQEIPYSWDIARNSLTFTAQFRAQFGFDPKPFAEDATRRLEMIHPDDRARLRDQWERVATSSQQQIELRYRIQAPGGRVVHVVDRARLLRDSEGRLAEIKGSLIDEQRLQAEEQRLRAVVEVAANVIYELDPATGIITYTDGMRATFGHDWLGTMQAGDIWSNLLHPEERDRVVAAFNVFVASTDRYARLQYRFRRADGGWAQVRERIIALRDEAGKAMRIVGGMEDITTELINAERLRQSDKLEAIGKLTGGVAHDFNNLLTVIIGNSGLLETDPDLSPERQMIARTVGSAARRGAELISSLMAFARRQPLAPKPLDTSAIIVELGELLRRTLPAHIDLQTIVPPGLWMVEADPAQLNAALLNLAVNASDAMPRGGRIVLECANAMLDASYVASMPELVTGEYLRLDMTDNGSGMPAEIAAQAFDPFFTTKPLGKGSGLGLSMVWGFAKQSGGHAKIYSEMGHGTKVTLYLPRSKLASPQEAAPQKAGPVPKGRGQHILVVEDDPMLRRFVVAMTERLNYRVDQAEDGQQALEILRQSPDISLLFTDVVMPGHMNGKELADKAKTEFPHLIVLFTSGYTENSIIHHGRLDEGVHFLAKPYHLGELAQKLASLFE